MRQYKVAHYCVNSTLFENWVYCQLRKHKIIKDDVDRSIPMCGIRWRDGVEYIGWDVPIRLKREIFNKVDLEACAKEFFAQCKHFASAKFSGTNVFLCDILRTQDPNQLEAYARNGDIMRVLKSDEFASRFPIFKEILRERLSDFCYRIFCLKRVNDFFFHLSTMEDFKLPQLPTDCTQLIFKYLDNKDLINIRKAYSLKSKVISKLWKTAKPHLTFRQPTGIITYCVIFEFPRL